MWLGPVPAILLGTIVMQRNGIRSSLWVQNTAVWVITTVFCGFLKWKVRRVGLSVRVSLLLMVISIVVILMTFLNPGLSGVHRWVKIGPVRLHGSAIMLPVFLLSMGSVDRNLGWILSLVTGGLLAIQPDAGQATAFITAVAVRRFIDRAGWFGAADYTAISSLFVLLIVAWYRPDPLGAVPYVEGIIGLAAAINPMMAVLGVAFLTLLPLPFLLVQTPRSQDRATSVGLGVYFAITLLVPLTGRFPVPLMGYGASPIIGYVVVLAWLLRSSPRARKGSCL